MLPPNHARVRGFLAVLVILGAAGLALVTIPTVAASIWEAVRGTW